MRHPLALIALGLVLLSSCRKEEPVRTSQNWLQSDQYRWYRGTQGSRLIPQSWLLSLEEAQSEQLFLRPESVERFGYLLPETDDKVQLPIGFAIDRGPIRQGMATDIRWAESQKADVPWVGMNCSACHTAEIRAGTEKLRIDGGPTLADFQTFVRSINASLAATAADPAKFSRFAAAVLCDTNLARPLGTMPRRDCAVSPEAAQKLKDSLLKLLDRQQQIASFNTTTSDYGYARLDAVGHIFNKVAFLVKADGQFGGPPDAPVSYPFIWNVAQHDFVQWNGIAPNKGAKLPSGETFDVGAVVRNASEVIGVFADVEVPVKPTVNGYASSVHIGNLDAMEVLLAKLQSPAWPDRLWKRNTDLADTVGKPLFQERCASCHAHLDRTDVTTPVKANMSPIWPVPGKQAVGTDPWMACNAFTYEALTGRLDGKKTGFLFGEERYGPRAFTRQMLVTTGVGVLFGKKRQITATAARAAFGLPREIETVTVARPGVTQRQRGDMERLRDCRTNAADPLMGYKGRPLNGIWATGPYLHNGSVKSLYELLLPPSQRDGEFWIGNREFDADNVGYKDEKSPYGSTFRTVDAQGNPIKGNSNAGHDYGNAELTDNQRKALVEYMKGL